MVEYMKAVETTLSTMGLRPLKPKQLEALQSFVSSKDTLVALPTGYGKSVIFAMLPLMFDYLFGKKLLTYSYIYILTCNHIMATLCFIGTSGSIAVVVTPLISLMIDQREKFKQKGIRVEFVGEAQTDDQVTQDAINGNIQLLYISPENLLKNKQFHGMLHSARYKENMKALVVDEAHCVKLW